MQQILINIDCDGELCGGCKFREFENCGLFDVWLGDIEAEPLRRCSQCLRQVKPHAVFEVLNIYKIGV